MGRGVFPARRSHPFSWVPPGAGPQTIVITGCRCADRDLLRLAAPCNVVGLEFVGELSLTGNYADCCRNITSSTWSPIRSVQDIEYACASVGTSATSLALRN